MPSIRRVKTKTDADGDLVGKPATHYVKQLSPAPVGSIFELTANAGEAGDFTAEQFEQVKSYYAGKKNAGEFFFDAPPPVVTVKAAEKAAEKTAPPPAKVPDKAAPAG